MKRIYNLTPKLRVSDCWLWLTNLHNTNSGGCPLQLDNSFPITNMELLQFSWSHHNCQGKDLAIIAVKGLVDTELALLENEALNND